MNIIVNMQYHYIYNNNPVINFEEKNIIDEIVINLDSLEKVLFALEIKDETILLTDRKIYFPRRSYPQFIEIHSIDKIKVVGYLSIQITDNQNKTHELHFDDTSSKIKLFKILSLLQGNLNGNIKVSIEEIKEIFESFTVLKNPPNQNQHKVPEIYLKQFGYLKGTQIMVSVRKNGEEFNRQKSIGSFTATTNIFDIEVEDDKLPRIFEQLNTELDNEYPGIIDDIENNQIITIKSHAFLVQIVANFMARSDYWRNFIKFMLESDRKEDFLKITIGFNTFEDFTEIDKKEYFKIISEGEINNDKINRTLLYFAGYIFHHIKHFDVAILQAPENKGWFTSNNPVIFIKNNEDGKFGICSIDSEFYLPLSGKYLAYFHSRKSNKQEPLFRMLENRKKYNFFDVASEDDLRNITDMIFKNSYEYVIFPVKIE